MFIDVSVNVSILGISEYNNKEGKKVYKIHGLSGYNSLEIQAKKYPGDLDKYVSTGEEVNLQCSASAFKDKIYLSLKDVVLG